MGRGRALLTLLDGTLVSLDQVNTFNSKGMPKKACSGAGSQLLLGHQLKNKLFGSA